MTMFSLRSLFSPRVSSFSAIAEPFKYFSTKRAGAVFADPTYDNTFKMLCTNKEHPGIIRSILNSFLDFEGNKMTWKFFELKKFKEFMKHELIDQHSPLKHQWMKFLLKCQDEEDTPENIPGIIKEGYQIMEMANWTPEQKALYDMEIDQEELTLCKVEKAGVEGKAKGRAEGRAEGLVEGRAEGLVEGEAKSIIKALKYNESDEEIIEEHDSLDEKKLSQIKSLSQPPKFDDIRTILQVDEGEFSKNDPDDIDVIGIGLEETPN